MRVRCRRVDIRQRNARRPLRRTGDGSPGLAYGDRGKNEGIMTPETFIALRMAELDPTEQAALLTMHAGDGRTYYLFNPAELARLRFKGGIVQRRQ